MDIWSIESNSCANRPFTVFHSSKDGISIFPKRFCVGGNLVVASTVSIYEEIVTAGSVECKIEKTSASGQVFGNLFKTAGELADRAVLNSILFNRIQIFELLVTFFKNTSRLFMLTIDFTKPSITIIEDNTNTSSTNITDGFNKLFALLSN